MELIEHVPTQTNSDAFICDRLSAPDWRDSMADLKPKSNPKTEAKGESKPVVVPAPFGIGIDAGGSKWVVATCELDANGPAYKTVFFEPSVIAPAKHTDIARLASDTVYADHHYFVGSKVFLPENSLLRGEIQEARKEYATSDAQDLVVQVLAQKSLQSLLTESRPYQIFFTQPRTDSRVTLPHLVTLRQTIESMLQATEHNDVELTECLETYAGAMRIKDFIESGNKPFVYLDLGRRQCQLHVFTGEDTPVDVYLLPITADALMKPLLKAVRKAESDAVDKPRLVHVEDIKLEQALVPYLWTLELPKTRTFDGKTVDLKRFTAFGYRGPSNIAGSVGKVTDRWYEDVSTAVRDVLTENYPDGFPKTLVATGGFSMVPGAIKLLADRFSAEEMTVIAVRDLPGLSDEKNQRSITAQGAAYLAAKECKERLL